MINFTKIKESCLYLEDLEKAKNFYHGKLGFRVINYLENKHIFFRVGTSVLLCFNPEDSKLKTSPPGHFAFGNQHIAFEVPHKDYDSAKNDMISSGIHITHEETWKNGLKSFYFNDPENNVLEILSDGMWE